MTHNNLSASRLLALAACTLLPPAAAVAQQAGVSHPEELNDSVTTHVVASSQSASGAALTAAAPQAVPATHSYAEPQAPAVLLDRDSATPVAAPTAATVAATAAAPIRTAPDPAPPAQGLAIAAQPTAKLPSPAADDDSAPISDAAVLARRADSPDVPRVRTPAPTAADGDIVDTNHAPPYEQPAGPMLKVLLRDRISTDVTRPGTPFYAELDTDYVRDGIVLLPAKSVVAGRITAVHGGTRIHGKASLHLQPQTLTLPDGTSFRVAAQVIDTDLYRSVNVTREGTIVRSDHVKGTLEAIGLATGATAAAGAVFGGPIGALVGAGVGAGLGTAVVLRQNNQQVLEDGTGLVLSLTAPLDVRPPAATPATLGR